VTLGGRFFYRSAENTPVVVAADTPMVGWLQYEYTDSRSVGLAADFRWHAAQALDLSGDAVLQSAVATGTNHRLPMTPDVDVRLRGDFILSPSITIFGTAAFQSAQAVSLDSTLPDLGSRFILGAGGAYKILSSLEAFAEVTNLTNGSYELWRNYQAPGLELRAGIRGTF
jgi:outer membrane receptor protein involved in Fe transport